jgi:hypothetical protein
MCRQINKISPEVRQIFRKGGQPSTSQLVNVLAAVVQNFPFIYLVIDALDESSEREKIMTLLLKISEDERFERLQILATSRREVDIERILLTKTTNLSLSNRYVDDDIELYIRSCLRGDTKLARLPEELKAEITIALVDGAEGILGHNICFMFCFLWLIIHRFRWVVCQLDTLKSLNSVANIRAALSELPKTLGETYERVLCTIPLESQNRVYKTLQLLAGGYVKTPDELAGALSVDEASLCFDLENRPLDVYGPLEHCACLITYAIDHNPDQYEDEDEDREVVTIELAHYTVKEFLTSDRIANSPASSFHMSDDTMNALAATCFVVYLFEGDY